MGKVGTSHEGRKKRTRKETVARQELVAMPLVKIACSARRIYFSCSHPQCFLFPYIPHKSMNQRMKRAAVNAKAPAKCNFPDNGAFAGRCFQTRQYCSGHPAGWVVTSLGP